MKKLKLFFVVTLLSVCFMAFSFDWDDKRDCNRHPDGAVGAPLDGGLLALLAAGGVAYYLGRRKKNKE